MVERKLQIKESLFEYSRLLPTRKRNTRIINTTSSSHWLLLSALNNANKVYCASLIIRGQFRDRIHEMVQW